MNDDEKNFDYMLKYIMIGDSSVGKSNILIQYLKGKFYEEFQTTIGREFGDKNLEIGNKIFRIQIWDTAGQEIFGSITRSYYKNSVCTYVVYDITNKQSFENIKNWIKDFKKHSPKTLLLVLIGNKIDLEGERIVSYEERNNYAKKMICYFLKHRKKMGKILMNYFIKVV